jgi:hypothetical protein
MTKHILLTLVGANHTPICHNLTLKECKDETHTFEMGTWESSWTPEISKFDCKCQNTSHWNVLYLIGKLSKCKCRKWACMGHLDIYSTHYCKKKSQESNLQFDSRPLILAFFFWIFNKFSKISTCYSSPMFCINILLHVISFDPKSFPTRNTTLTIGIEKKVLILTFITYTKSKRK